MKQSSINNTANSQKFIESKKRPIESSNGSVQVPGKD